MLGDGMCDAVVQFGGVFFSPCVKDPIQEQALRRGVAFCISCAFENNGRAVVSAPHIIGWDQECGDVGEISVFFGDGAQGALFPRGVGDAQVDVLGSAKVCDDLREGDFTFWVDAAPDGDVVRPGEEGRFLGVPFWGHPVGGRCGVVHALFPQRLSKGA